jgi:NADH-quinone oxidoreductase subunit J
MHVLGATVADSLVFAVAAAVVLVGAVGVVVSRNPVHAALMLVMTLFGVAVLFVAQQADFLAAVQVIVYAGAIVVLFLFVIMLLGVDREEAVRVDPLRGQRPLAVVLGVLTLAELLLLAHTQWATGQASTTGALSGPDTNVGKLARAIFTRYLLAFEATSVLLVIAVVGAVVLARRPGRTPGSAEGAGDPAEEEPGEPGAPGESGESGDGTRSGDGEERELEPEGPAPARAGDGRGAMASGSQGARA